MTIAHLCLLYFGVLIRPSVGTKQNPFALTNVNDNIHRIDGQFLVFFDTDCLARKDENMQQQFLTLFECYNHNMKTIDLYPNIGNHWIVLNRQPNCNLNDRTSIELHDYCIDSVVPDQIITASSASKTSDCKCESRKLKSKLWNLDSLTPKITDGFEFVKCESRFDPGFDLIVMDTGVDGDHSEFDGITFDRLFDAYPDQPNFNYHGTHVAGTFCGFKYGAFRAKNTNINLLDVRVLDSFGYGYICDGLNGYASIVAYLQNTTRKAIINLSLAGSRGRDIGIFDVYLEMIRENEGIMIAAAGNAANDSCLMSPALSPHTITVGSIDQNFELSWFSNYGDCVDIWAPGEGIWSAYIAGGIIESQGTSMAAPLVAGVAANILVANPSFEFQDVKDVLLDSAKDEIEYVTPEGERFCNEPRVEGSCKTYGIPCSKNEKSHKRHGKRKQKKKSHAAFDGLMVKDGDQNMNILRGSGRKYVVHLNVNLWMFASVLLLINMTLCCLCHQEINQWNRSK
eukprot:212059_1